MNKHISKFSHKTIAIMFIIAIFFVADRFLKNFALKLDNQQNYKLIDDFLIFSLTQNYGIAFSLPFSGTWLLPIIFFVIIGLIVATTKNIFQEKKISIVSLSLILIIFGAISNLIDRVLYGFVIDYLEIQNISILNLADIMISIGAIIYLKIIFTSPIKINFNNRIDFI